MAVPTSGLRRSVASPRGPCPSAASLPGTILSTQTCSHTPAPFPTFSPAEWSGISLPGFTLSSKHSCPFPRRMADGAEPRGTVCASFGAAWNPARARGCVLFIHSPSVSYTCGDSPQPQPHPLPASTNRPRPGWGWGSRRRSGDLEEQEGGSVRTGAHSLTVFSASPRIHAHSHPTETAGHAEETE